MAGAVMRAVFWIIVVAAILRGITEDGPAVDGVTGRPAFQVDGLPWEVHGGVMREVLAELD